MFRALMITTVCLAAAGCSDDAADYPRLLPTQQILAEPSLPDHAGPITDNADPLRQAVQARGAATQARAGTIADPADGRDLAARAADLRRRADALRSESTAPADACQTGAATPECSEPAR
ncbi:hypothetical protein FNJ84_13265 [Paracoccus sp. M683]|uniref:hypothetical protein n=1 Tax=Paracoccus sp. M683 TaxID=2594268 RepID=UPI001193809F|nr:hypothetical protein [Paracoccus sp. M683]TRW96252.1 hypothetical protein FNJ84_13265 [Paracoccus sp. M683]